MGKKQRVLGAWGENGSKPPRKGLDEDVFKGDLESTIQSRGHSEFCKGHWYSGGWFSGPGCTTMELGQSPVGSGCHP